MIDDARAELLRRVAHDLRSPLGVLQGTLDDLPSLATADERQVAMQRARRAVSRLLRLADHLSLTGRVAQGFTVVPSTVDVRALAEASVAAVQQAEPRSQIGVHLDGQGIWATDQALLRAALDELVSNAFKNARTEVWITVASDAVVVEDDGAGLDPAAVPAVFHQIGPNRHGLGLGLPLASALAHTLEMKLTVAAGKNGGLSRFTLRS